MIDFILERLAIGNYADALNPPPEVSAMLCVAEERDIPEPGCLCHKVPMADMRPVPAQQLKEAVEWIRNNIRDHRILVFCNAGIGRAPSVVMAYLCCVSGYSFGEAVEAVASMRPYMSPLPNLFKTIKKLRNQMK